MGQILTFLQMIGPCPIILCQVFVLGILFQRLLAFHSLFKTFIQDGCLVALWKLNLDFLALQRPWFEPIGVLSLSAPAHGCGRFFRQLFEMQTGHSSRVFFFLCSSSVAHPLGWCAFGHPISEFMYPLMTKEENGIFGLGITVLKVVVNLHVLSLQCILCIEV